MEILISLLFALLAYQFQLTLHEGSHAIAALLMNCKVHSFKVYPHVSEGVFYFGRVRWSYDENTTREDRKKQKKFILYAPYPVATFMGLTWLILFAIIGWKFFLVFFSAAMIDLARNHLRFDENSDVSKVHQTTSVRIIIAALAMIAIVGANILFFTL